MEGAKRMEIRSDRQKGVSYTDIARIEVVLALEGTVVPPGERIALED